MLEKSWRVGPMESSAGTVVNVLSSRDGRAPPHARDGDARPGPRKRDTWRFLRGKTSSVNAVPTRQASFPPEDRACFEDAVSTCLSDLRDELLKRHDEEVGELHDELRRLRSQLEGEPRMDNTVSMCDRSRTQKAVDSPSDQSPRERKVIAVDQAQTSPDMERPSSSIVALDQPRWSTTHEGGGDLLSGNGFHRNDGATVVHRHRPERLPSWTSRTQSNVSRFSKGFSRTQLTSALSVDFSASEFPRNATLKADTEPDSARRRIRYAMKETWLSKYDLVNAEMNPHHMLNAHMHSLHQLTTIKARDLASKTMEDLKVRSTWDTLTAWTSSVRRKNWLKPLDPHSKTVTMWAMLSFALLAYDIVVVPVDVAFDLPLTWYFSIVAWIGRCFWTIDIPVNMVTAKFVNGILEKRLRRVLLRYLTTWFPIDILIVSAEWTMLAVTTGYTTSMADFSPISLLRIGRLVRLLRLLRLGKLRNLHREFAFFVSANVPGCIEIFSDSMRITLYLAIGVHMSTCFWFGVGKMTDAGWVFESSLNGESSTDILMNYMISLHWTLSNIHGQSNIHPVTTFERAFASAAVFVGLLFVCFLIAKTNLAVMMLTDSKAAHMQQISGRFLKRRNITPALSVRVRNSLRAYHDEGLGEQLQDEGKMMETLPLALQCDLHAEVRGSILVNMQFFSDLNKGNPRIIRQLSFEAMQDSLALEGETVFAPGDGSQCMYFVDAGALLFRTVQQMADSQWGPATLTQQRLLSASPSSIKGVGDKTKHLFSGCALCSTVRDANKMSAVMNTTSPEGTMLWPNHWASEASLWIDWEHRGELIAFRDSILLSLHAHNFYDVISLHQGACLHAVKYARHFAWHMNHSTVEPNDLIQFDLQISRLNDELFNGSEEDHFIFISHYKKEAGTEASLMQDHFIFISHYKKEAGTEASLMQAEMEKTLRQDTSNAASELRAPVFLDSENLVSLTTITEHVRRSRNLILLLTPDVLTRPWCLMEIVAAQRNNVPIVPVEVCRPGEKFLYPTDQDYYHKLRTGEIVRDGDLPLFDTEGISLADIEDALRQVFNKISLPFSPHRSAKVRQAELQEILRRCPPMEFTFNQRPMKSGEGDSDTKKKSNRSRSPSRRAQAGVEDSDGDGAEKSAKGGREPPSPRQVFAQGREWMGKHVNQLLGAVDPAKAGGALVPQGASPKSSEAEDCESEVSVRVSQKDSDEQPRQGKLAGAASGERIGTNNFHVL